MIKVSPVPYTHSFREFGGRRQPPPLHQPIKRGLRDRQVLGRFFRPQKTWFHNQFPSNEDKEESCSGRKHFCFYASTRLRILSICLFFGTYYHLTDTSCKPITVVAEKRCQHHLQSAHGYGMVYTPCQFNRVILACNETLFGKSSLQQKQSRPQSATERFLLS